ncbi:hypothetical protein HYQ46_000955 [Verticillium longisporum]|nr:hypothetical protein HYQ46_000955 [Verticillium longisporum]
MEYIEFVKATKLREKSGAKHTEIDLNIRVVLLRLHVVRAIDQGSLMCVIRIVVFCFFVLLATLGCLCVTNIVAAVEYNATLRIDHEVVE